MTIDGRTEVTEWNTLQYGDMVTLTGEKGCSYKFLSALVDEDGECIHVNLYGGRNGKVKKDGYTGKRMLRSILPARVVVPDEKALDRQRRLRAMKEAGE